jgi:hypothetical protein
MSKGPMETPARPPGRPRHQADEVKSHPLVVIRSNSDLKNAVAKAATASGRSLAGEIEYRLRQSLAADRGKSIDEVLLDRVKAKFPGLVAEELHLMAAEYSAHAHELDVYTQKRAAGLSHEDALAAAAAQLRSERDAGSAPDELQPKPIPATSKIGRS